jgi:hypothetical protein
MLRQVVQQRFIACDKRFPLRAGPTLHLRLAFPRLRESRVVFRVQQLNGWVEVLDAREHVYAEINNAQFLAGGRLARFAGAALGLRAPIAPLGIPLLRITE